MIFLAQSRRCARLGFLLFLLPCAGCLVNRSSVRQVPLILYSTNGVPFLAYHTLARATTFAGGNAQQSVAQLKASVTRAGVISAGAQGIEQEAKGAELVAELAGLVEKLNVALERLNKLRSPFPLP